MKLRFLTTNASIGTTSSPKVVQLAKPVAALELKVVSTGPKGNFPSDFCKSRREISGGIHTNFPRLCIK